MFSFNWKGNQILQTSFKTLLFVSIFFGRGHWKNLNFFGLANLLWIELYAFNLPKQKNTIELFNVIE